MAELEESLTWRLSDEGMDLLERAGLAALYMTLRAAEESTTDLSPLRWNPTDLTSDSVTLRWAGPAKAAFVTLMEFAWQVRDGVLFLPAVHGERELSQWWLRVPMHNGIMRTFFQHTNVQPKGEPVTKIVNLDENREIQLSFQPPIIRPAKEKVGAGPPSVPKKLLKPHKDVADLFDRHGEFRKEPVELSNWLYPGIAGRFNDEGAWVGDARQAVVLMIAPITCLFQRLSGEGGNWVFVVPDIRELAEFAAVRKRLNLDAEFTDIASLGDAGLQFLAEYSTRSPRKSSRSGCTVVAMGKVNYYASQSIRKAVLSIPPELAAVKRYRLLQNALPNTYVSVSANPPNASTVPPAPKRSRKTKRPPKARTEMADSPRAAGFIKLAVGRGRIADNLVNKRAWYRDLTTPTHWDLGWLERQRQPGESMERTFYRNICYQRSKFMKLIQDDDIWDSEAEKAFMQAFWETLDSLYAQEADAVKRGGARTATDRFDDLNEDIRRRLMRAKTRMLLRAALTELFAKAGRQKTLRSHPAALWRLIDDPVQWHKGRDLALLALASHRKKDERERSNTPIGPKGV